MNGSAAGSPLFFLLARAKEAQSNNIKKKKKMFSNHHFLNPPNPFILRNFISFSLLSYSWIEHSSYYVFFCDRFQLQHRQHHTQSTILYIFGYLGSLSVWTETVSSLTFFFLYFIYRIYPLSEPQDISQRYCTYNTGEEVRKSIFLILFRSDEISLLHKRKKNVSYIFSLKRLRRINNDASLSGVRHKKNSRLRSNETRTKLNRASWAPKKNVCSITLHSNHWNVTGMLVESERESARDISSAQRAQRHAKQHKN